MPFNGPMKPLQWTQPLSGLPKPRPLKASAAQPSLGGSLTSTPGRNPSSSASSEAASSTSHRGVWALPTPDSYSRNKDEPRLSATTISSPPPTGSQPSFTSPALTPCSPVQLFAPSTVFNQTTLATSCSAETNPYGYPMMPLHP
ncbi:hypothetical protein C8Q73DRAFT_690718 [Cubamyces lactineus]|nr:hypothetical protein C8Q73DRAFT_713718 [Cubamyces lactineus]KAH9888096.1 hypothetical protein C8Q73DRAFT_712237 [Cubamyces lactineus]KAH9896069.1 hypothetical protein C8Q73DRAFT_690718 [Cubamyces lactineus]